MPVLAGRSVQGLSTVVGSVLGFCCPGAILAATALWLVVKTGIVSYLWFPEALLLLGLLLLVTGLLGVLAGRKAEQWPSATFAGACLATLAVESGLLVIVYLERERLVQLEDYSEPTGGLPAVLRWCRNHEVLTILGLCLVGVAQIGSFTANLVSLLLWLDREESKSGELEGRSELAAPLLGKSEVLDEWASAYKTDVEAQVKRARHQARRPWKDIGMTVLFAYMATLGFLFLLATANLNGEESDARDGHRSTPGMGNGSSSGNDTLPWYPGVLAVVGGPLMLTGSLAATGVWWGTISPVHCFAGASLILLTSEGFALKMLWSYRRLLDNDGSYDAGTGLQSTLIWAEDHPVASAISILTLILFQICGLVAAALYAFPRHLILPRQQRGRELEGFGASDMLPVPDTKPSLDLDPAHGAEAETPPVWPPWDDKPRIGSVEDGVGIVRWKSKPHPANPRGAWLPVHRPMSPNEESLPASTGTPPRAWPPGPRPMPCEEEIMPAS